MAASAPLALLAASVAIAAMLAADARAEACRCEAVQFSWKGCDASGTCGPGAWSGCTPSPEDSYTIGTGCRVDVAPGSDVVLAAQSTDPLRVETGGRFTMRHPGELRLSPAGLEAAPGATVALTGCFRSASSPDACAPSLDEDALFQIGRVVPCRDGDCRYDSELVRIHWPASAAPEALASIDALLASVRPLEDALCFWQRSEAGPLGADSGYCYRITAARGGSGDRTLDFDVRQSWSAQSDQAGAPLARRGVLELTLSGDAAAGARRLRFDEPSLVEGRAGPVGRWLRCGGDARSFLVASAEDDPAGDTVLLADQRGLDRAHPAGTRCHLDWGWSEGDVAYVMAPVHVTSAVHRPDEAGLLLEGTTTLRAVVVDGLGGGPRRSAIEVRGGPLLALEHVWVVDPLVTDTAAVLLEDLPCNSAVWHLSVTGGPADARDDKNYGLAWYGGATCSYFVRHLYTRYAGDDNFVLESSGARPVGEIDLQWVHAGPASHPGDSGQLFDFGAPNPTRVHVRDALCTSCTSDDGYGSLVLGAAAPGEVSGLLWVGTHNGGLDVIGDAPEHPIAFRNVGVVGSDVDASNPIGGGSWIGLDTRGFYVRDVRDPRPTPMRLCSGLSFFGNITRRQSAGVFVDVELGGTPCELDAASLSDVYFLDVRRSGAPGPLLEVQPWAGGVALERLTLAFRSAATGLTHGVAVPSLDAARATTLDGVLTAGMQGADVVQAMSLGSPLAAASAQWGHPSCFHDNAADDSPDVLAAYGVEPVRGVEPRFVDPAALRFDLGPDSALRPVGCGAGTAGVAASDWAHRKAKLEPIYVGPRSSACGLGAELTPLGWLGLAWLHRMRRRWRLSRG